MSNKFLDEMKSMASQFGTTGNSGYITRMKIEFGFHAYNEKGQDQMAFWKACKNKKEADVIIAELQARLDAANLNKDIDFCVRIFTDKDVLNREKGSFEYDNNHFYHQRYWENTKKTETEGRLIFAEFTKNEFPIEEWFWGRYIFKAKPYFQLQGESGKTEGKDGVMRWPSFVLPIEKFSSEKEAREAAGGNDNGESSKWSKQALAIGIEVLEYDANNIYEALENALAGKALMGNPLPEVLDGENCKEYVAKIWKIEASDIDQLTPF